MQALLDAEQRPRRPLVDPRRIAAGVVPSIDPRFLPQARTVFHLAATWRRVAVVDGGASGWLTSALVRGSRALCFEHPLVREGRSGFLGTPTASIRTLLAWPEARPDRPFFLKLPVALELGGQGRAFDAAQAAQCVRRSALIRAFGGRGLQVVPETLALGASIVRELPPRTRLLPWFAIRRAAPRPLIRGFLRAFLTSAVEHGWAPDAHAQNLLVDQASGRFFVRDFEDVGVDLPFIAAAHPRLAARCRALDPRMESDFADQLEASLHGYFLGGPVFALGARQVFFEELAALTKADVRAPRAFRDWVLEQRERQLRAPAPPARLRRWLWLEQKVNRRARDPRRFAPVDLGAIPPRFRPEARPVFRLPYLPVPRAHVRVSTAAGVPVALRSALLDPTCARVFFHPMMAEAHALDAAQHGLGLDVFWATPTASPRSLVVWPDGRPAAAFGLKVSLPVALLNLDRRIGRGKLERAVAVSGCLARAPGVPHLAEPIAIRLGDGAWGSIGRVLPRRPGVPGFALFARRRPARAWVEGTLFPALARAFGALAFGEGLIPDLHQQNVLWREGAVVVRDLDACKTDLELRWRRGKTFAPFARARGTLAELKLDLGGSHFDEAWEHGLRADWLWLAGGGRALGDRLDALMLAEAQRWLGPRVVNAELLRAGRTRFSLNAMVHAWKQRQPAVTGARGDPASFRRLAIRGRATVPALPRGARVFRDGPLLIAAQADGRPTGFALIEARTQRFTPSRS